MKNLFTLLATALVLFISSCQTEFLSPDTTITNATTVESLPVTDLVTSTTTSIPPKVYTVLAYILKYHKAPSGYVGGSVFTNVEKVLPTKDAKGKTITYQEWDVNKHINGVNRGAERIVTGSDGRNWYTADHYKTFTLIK